MTVWEWITLAPVLAWLPYFAIWAVGEFREQRRLDRRLVVLHKRTSSGDVSWEHLEALGKDIDDVIQTIHRNRMANVRIGRWNLAVCAYGLLRTIWIFSTR